MPRHECLAGALFVAMLLLGGAAFAEMDVRVSALFDGRAVLEIDGNVRMLRVGQISPEGVRLVSADARKAIIDIDGKRQSLELSRHIGGSFAAPERISVAVARNANGEYLVAGSINGQQLQMLVDTGANVIALNSKEARRLGIDFRLQGSRSQVQTASGVVDAWSVTLDRVEVSGILVRNVQASVLEGDFPARTLLGMSWLSRVSLRDAVGVLYIEQR